jgi:hypothetical protein
VISRPDVGRAHQRPALFTTGQLFGFACVATALVAFPLWHATLVITAGVPATAIGITLRALISAAPLTFPGYDPAGTGVTLAVFAVLLLAAATGVGWLLWRTPKRQPKTVGFADQVETRQSSGEQRARRKAA